MTAIVSLLAILTFSFLVTRLATVALTLTGVSQDLARLQSVSAFTGVGFTTRESEWIVQHPVRRRLLLALMIVGNAGFVTAISSLVLGFAGVDRAGEGLERAGWLAVGLLLLLLAVRSRRLENLLRRWMRRALTHWTSIEAKDYAAVLDLRGDYGVRELAVSEDDWVTGRRLDELQLLREGIFVLGIHRHGGRYVGVPRGETEIRSGDRLVLYGRDEDVQELDVRRQGPAGDADHARAVGEHQRERREQARDDVERDHGREPKDEADEPAAGDEDGGRRDPDEEPRG